MNVETIIYYSNEEKIYEEPMIFSRLHGVGEEVVLNFIHYEVEKVEVRDSVQHVYMKIR
jgi:hypothetical protein